MRLLVGQLQAWANARIEWHRVDGATWAIASTSSQATLYSIVEADGQYVAAGDGGTVLVSTYAHFLGAPDGLFLELSRAFLLAESFALFVLPVSMLTIDRRETRFGGQFGTYREVAKLASPEVT